MALIVGIDFGTSTTVVRYRLENSDEIQAVKDGTSDIIPTAIFRNANNTTEYGWQALTSAMFNPEGLITNFKMDLLDSNSREQTVKLIEEFLRYVYGLFQTQIQIEQIHYNDMDVNISYPAKWDDEMSKMMKEAVAAAGFRGNIRGVKEPEAAMRNMVWNHLRELQRARLLGANKSLRIFLLDMGAGTTDISIFRLTIDEEGIPHMTEPFSYPSKTENILCGGREIDEALRNYVLNYCTEKSLDATDFVQLSMMKHWKDGIVSQKLKAEQSFPLLNQVVSFFRANRRDDYTDFSLDRADFEQLTKRHWKNLYRLIVSAMAQYPYAKPEDIDFVCLTGGHSAWYTVPNLFNGKGVCNRIARKGIDPDYINFQKLIEEPWRWNVVLDSKPHECVARGLCLMDERMIVDLSSSNNVWAQITINGQEGELTQVVNKSNILPVSTETSLDAKIKCKLLKKIKVNAQIDIYTGETLQHAEHRVYRMKEGADSVLKKLISLLLMALKPKALLGVPIFKLAPIIDIDIDTKVTMKVTMTEEGFLEIDGEFKVDDKSLKFTYDDMEIVKDVKEA